MSDGTLDPNEPPTGPVDPSNPPTKPPTKPKGRSHDKATQDERTDESGTTPE